MNLLVESGCYICPSGLRNKTQGPRMQHALVPAVTAARPVTDGGPRGKEGLARRAHCPSTSVAVGGERTMV